MSQTPHSSHSEFGVSQDAIDAASITAQIRRIFPNGEAVELRCLTEDGCRSGVYDDLCALGHDAATENTNGANCHFGLNPPSAESAPVTNALTNGSAVRSEDVSQRRRLLIDVDAVRESGISSTDTEKAYALAVLNSVVKSLVRDHGWTAPLVADSGGGFHALFAVDLESEDGGLVRQLLKSLAQSFDTDHAKIDTSVADAPRVCRLPGTINRKGANTPERPHRLARLLGTNNAGAPISREVIVATIERLQKQTPSTLAARSEIDECDGTSARLANAGEWLTQQPLPNPQDSDNRRLCAMACKLFRDFGLSKLEVTILLNDYVEQHQSAMGGSCNAVDRERIVSWADEQTRDRRTTNDSPSDNDNGKSHVTPDEKELRSTDEQLVDMATAHHALWHTPDNETYATVPLADGGFFNIRVQSNEYRTRLISDYYMCVGTIPKKLHVDAALDTLAGLALVKGKEHQTFLRVAGDEGQILIDVGDTGWNVIEVSADGWNITQTPTVKFRRSAGLAALPDPERNGNIGFLREFVNVTTFDEFIFVIAFLLMASHPFGEYVILVLLGQQGSAKSTLAKIIRRLCDSNRAPLRSPPRNEDDFSVSAANNRLVVFDNQSHIPDWLSDALCRMSTGGTNAKRKHYTNGEEVLVSYSNPALLNGVVDLLRRPDLMDRCLTVQLPPLESRVSSGELWASFEEVAGKVLGGLLDALVYALAHPCEDIEDVPRMAEFAKFVSAAEPELARQWNEFSRQSESAGEQWNAGDFLPAYRQAIAKAKAQAIEQVPWIPHLEALLNRQGGRIEMPATQLLVALQQLAMAADEPTYKNAGWPISATGLGNALQRLAPVLREHGIFVERQRKNGGNRQRLWVITYDDGGSSEEPDAESPGSGPNVPDVEQGNEPGRTPEQPLDQSDLDAVFEEVQKFMEPEDEDHTQVPDLRM